MANRDLDSVGALYSSLCGLNSYDYLPGKIMPKAQVVELLSFSKNQSRKWRNKRCRLVFSLKLFH